jgi:hypothetical protein
MLSRMKTPTLLLTMLVLVAPAADLADDNKDI